MKKKLGVFLIAAVIAVAFMPVTAFAGSNKVKMTAYDQVIKSGKIVYCSSQSGIYKVTLKKGKPKKVKTLFRYPNGAKITLMKKNGKYLYFNENRNGTEMWALKRVGISGGKMKLYQTTPEGEIFYAIKKKNIYFEVMEARLSGEEWDDYMIDYVMPLSGTTKKETSKYPSMKRKKTNAKGYKIIEVQKGNVVKTYLKVPKAKKKYLGTCVLIQ